MKLHRADCHNSAFMMVLPPFLPGNSCWLPWPAHQVLALLLHRGLTGLRAGIRALYQERVACCNDRIPMRPCNVPASAALSSKGSLLRAGQVQAAALCTLGNPRIPDGGLSSIAGAHHGLTDMEVPHPQHGRYM
jgi:hypothetical protein